MVASLIECQFAEHRIPIDRRAIDAAIGKVLGSSRVGFILVARRRDLAAGVAYVAFTWSLEHGGRSAWLEELYVIPEMRGQGVGGALLEAALARAREEGCAAVDLEVDRDHACAEHLYRRAGFAPLPRTRWVKKHG